MIQWQIKELEEVVNVVEGANAGIRETACAQGRTAIADALVEREERREEKCR